MRIPKKKSTLPLIVPFAAVAQVKLRLCITLYVITLLRLRHAASGVRSHFEILAYNHTSLNHFRHRIFVAGLVESIRSQ